MPRFLAIDWDDQQLRYVCANTASGEVVIDEAAAIPFENAEKSGTPKFAQLAQLIDHFIEDRTYRSLETLLVLRRADAEVRILSLPQGPADELPDMVKFQALREFSELSEDWPIDYFPIPKPQADSITVAAAAIPAAVKTEIIQQLNRGDLKSHSLLLRPCAAASFVHFDNLQRKSSAESSTIRTQLMVDLCTPTLELTILLGETPAFMRSVHFSVDHSTQLPTQLESEIRRTMLAVRNQLASDQVQEIIIFGQPEIYQAQADKLSEKLQIPIRLLNPFDAAKSRRGFQPPAQPGRFVALLGALMDAANDRRPAIDWLHPRRSLPPASNRRTYVLAAVAAVVLLVALLGGAWWQVRSLDQEILRMQRELQQLEPTVEVAEQTHQELVAIQEWLDGDINWLTQLADISVELPEAERARVREWRASVTTTGQGQLVLEGVVDEQSTIAVLERNLRESDRSVRGEGGQFEQEEQDYPWQFRELITIEPGAASGASLVAGETSTNNSPRTAEASRTGAGNE